MSALDVGSGLWNFLQANGDKPIADSVFHTNKNKSIVEAVQGTKGTYRATNATGQDGAPTGNWEFYGPFDE